MIWNVVLFLLGCVLAWFVLLPILLLGTWAAGLFAYAIFTELGDYLSGNSQAPIFDAAAAREMARRMCY
jgi:Sec-independent protein secretion pathway component TatC